MLNFSPGLGGFLILVALIIVVLFARFRSRARRDGKNDAASWWMHSDTDNAGRPDRDDPSSPGHGPDHGGDSGRDGGADSDGSD